jgi:hypothetical protein
MNQNASAPAAHLMTMKILIGSLIAGVVIFLAIVIAVFRSGELLSADPWAVDDVSVLVGLVLGISLLGISVVVPDLIGKNQLRQVPQPGRGERPAPGWEGWPIRAPALFPIYQTTLILRGALLEAPALTNVIVYMQTGSGIALILALVLIGALIGVFPTEPKVRAWIERMDSETSTL